MPPWKTRSRFLLQDIQGSQSEPSLTITSEIHLSRPLPTNFNAILYRIVQEGLTNIVKHADASHVHLRLASTSAAVTLSLEDDGIGFAPDQARTEFGLQSMRDRAQATGGTFTLISSNTLISSHTPSTGTHIQVSLPLSSIASPVQ